MRTSKPIATISYNTEDYLLKKLKILMDDHQICDYVYIKHKAEADEKKDHIHLHIKPNTLLDTMDLQAHFKEADFKNPKKPLGCIDFVYSDIDEWILYDQHYPPYLASKGESREYTYSKEDFRFADEDTFDQLYYHAFKGSKWAQRYELLQKLNDNELNPSELVLNGTVPLQMASQLNALQYMKRQEGKLDRGGRPNHELDQERINNRQAEMNLADQRSQIEWYENQIKFLQECIDIKLKKRYDSP